MKFSIVIPIYNVEKYLERCLKSVLRQTYKNLEIILVDDGSPDNCPFLCDKFSKTDGRIKVIHKANGGLSDARNVGMLSATGDYILFVDSDDRIIEDAIEKFHYCIIHNEFPDVVIGQLLNEDGTYYCNHYKVKSSIKMRGIDYFNKYYKNISSCAVSYIIKRSFLNENNLRFKVGVLHEDDEFTPRLYCSATTVVYCDNPFYIRYVNSNSITNQKNKCKNLMDTISNCYSLLEYSKKINNLRARKNIQHLICFEYLSMFYAANIFQYKNIRYKDYIDKKLLLCCSKRIYDFLKTVVFCISPEFYIKLNSLVKK